ncbi:MAG: hypothetical protein HOM11_06035 [Methylococcales bacterium]|jgi:hypothetical protein|nr:hypothetical protein [Methylococcales bacterium]
MAELSSIEIEERRVRRETFLESAKLEGIELTDKEHAMFDLFDIRGLSTEECITFIKKQHGYE